MMQGFAATLETAGAGAEAGWGEEHTFAPKP